MSRTTTELATEVLTLLGLIDAQEEPSAEDAALIKRAYSDRYEEWQIRNLTYWAEADIPNAVFRNVARIIADDVATSFGKPPPVEVDENGQTVSMGVKGLRGLRRVIEKKSAKLPVRSVYY